MSAVINNAFTDYKVADISLADWGRREVIIAESEMPAPAAPEPRRVRLKRQYDAEVAASAALTEKLEKHKRWRCSRASSRIREALS